MFSERRDWDRRERDWEPEELSHRGRVVAELSWEQEERRKGRLIPRVPKRTLFIWTVVGCLMVFPVLVPPTPDSLAMYLMIYVFGPIVLLLVAVFLEAPLPRAVKVYENGVLVELPTGRQYLPCGSFSSWAMNRVSNEPDVLRLSGGLYTVEIPDTLEGFNRWVDDVKEKIGDERYQQMDPDGVYGVKQAAFSRSILHTAVFAFLTTSIFAYVYIDNWLELPEGYLLVTLLLFYLGGAIYFHPWVVSRVLSPGMVSSYGLDPRRLVLLTAVSAVLLIGGFVGVLCASTPGIWYDEDDVVMHGDPGTSFLAPGEYADQLIIAEGPVAVHAGETLKLVNCTLTFLPSPGSGYGLWVGPGGSLELHNTTVTCNDHMVGYTFEIHGSALIEGSTVEATSEREDWDDLDSGVEIFSNDVVIRNTTVRNSNELGMLVYHCSPVIENCTFDGTVRSALVVSRGDPLVTDCLFIDCLRGVWLWDSDAKVSNCTFQRNRYGLFSQWGSPTVEWCDFTSTNFTAIITDINGNASLVGNTFNSNGADVEREDMAMSRVYLILFVVLMFPIMTWVMTINDLRKKWKKSRRS